MPCGHAIGSNSMVCILNDVIQKNKDCKIYCKAIKSDNWRETCETEWPFRLCKIIANLSKSESMYIDNGFAQIYSKNRNMCEDCPQCSTSIVREDNDRKINKVQCPMCSKNGKNQFFCWTCKRPWANKNSNTECGHELCDYRNNLNSILSRCELNEESEVNNQVKGVPKFRACPKCNILIEHVKNCKHITCSSCKT